MIFVVLILKTISGLLWGADSKSENRFALSRQDFSQFTIELDKFL